MQNKYWVRYSYEVLCYGGTSTETISDFVNTGVGCEFLDLEQWWIKESSGDILHELLQVVKL
jgi:hypothetical protein